MLTFSRKLVYVVLLMALILALAPAALAQGPVVYETVGKCTAFGDAGTGLTPVVWSNLDSGGMIDGAWVVRENMDVQAHVKHGLLSNQVIFHVEDTEGNYLFGSQDGEMPDNPINIMSSDGVDAQADWLFKMPSIASGNYVLVAEWYAGGEDPVIRACAPFAYRGTGEVVKQTTVVTTAVGGTSNLPVSGGEGINWIPFVLVFSLMILVIAAAWNRRRVRVQA